jgi:cell division transport system permease protein
LAGVPGVTEVVGLERSEAEALLEPWLGRGGLEDLPVPHLVVVELDPKSPADRAALDAALRAEKVDAVIHDYEAYLGDVRRAGALARAGAVGTAALIAAAAAAVIAFATRAGMNARREVVEVLHLSGAEDAMLARLFQARFARLAALAGVIGAGAVAVIAGGLRAVSGSGGFLPILPVDWSDLPWLVLCPVFAALIAAVSARRTAMDLLTGFE